jgi:hypothetical protein
VRIAIDLSSRRAVVVGAPTPKAKWQDGQRVGVQTNPETGAAIFTQSVVFCASDTDRPELVNVTTERPLEGTDKLGAPVRLVGAHLATYNTASGSGQTYQADAIELLTAPAAGSKPAA